MYRIESKEVLAPGLVLMRIRAPRVAQNMRAGQFVIVGADERAERIPLSVADWTEDSLTVIFQEVGTSTRKLGSLEAGDELLNLAGPLGRPALVAGGGNVVVACGCFGIGPGYALARALRDAGDRVTCIVEGRNRNWLFWQERLEAVAHRLIVTCGDGSAEARYATDPLDELLKAGEVDRVYALGCTFMMMECSRVSRPYGVETRVSLMPLMVDGTGMCGACRCTVGDEVKLGCVDGPEFDGHQVDWDLIIERARGYLDEETVSLDLWERENWHRSLR